jgi:thiol-disulfide isomerase/thioredoxin
MKYTTALWVALAVIVAAAVAIGVIIFAVDSASEKQKTQTNASTARESADQLPSFSLPDYQSKIVSLDDLKREVLVINMWASWCPFCTNELPTFAKLQKAFPDRVRVIAMNRGESVQNVKC